MAAPSNNNKYYISTTKGGYNKALVINANNGSVLPNCCGLVHGRWLECVGATDPAKDPLCLGNARSYYAMAQLNGLKTGSTPKLGAVVCYDDGKYGHVAFVEKIIKGSDGSVYSIYLSNSMYGGGRWYYRTVYAKNHYEYANMKLQGFIYNDLVIDEPDALAVGDKVEIIHPGRASSKGSMPIAYGIGWHRYIKNIYLDREYPYQVGNDTGTTGFYKAEALKKL